MDDSNNNELSDNYKRKFREILLQIPEWPEYDITCICNQIIEKSPNNQEQTRKNLEEWVKKISDEAKDGIYYNIFRLKILYYIFNILIGAFILGFSAWLVLLVTNLNSISDLNVSLSILLFLWMIYLLYILFYSKFKFANLLYASAKVVANLIANEIWTIVVKRPSRDKNLEIYSINIPIYLKSHFREWLLILTYIIIVVTIGIYLKFATDIYLHMLIIEIYVIIFLIPQIFVSLDLSKSKYPKGLARQLDTDDPDYRAKSIPLKNMAAINYTYGFINRELNDEKGDTRLTEKNLGEVILKMADESSQITPDFELRRAYADSLAPYIPLHTFFFSMIIYLISPNTISFHRTIGFLGLDIQIQFVLALGIALCIYNVFINIPFYYGQNKLKEEKLSRLRHKYRNAQIQLEELVDNNLAVTAESCTINNLENSAKIRDFFKNEIELVEKIPLHPHRIETTKWIGLTAVIFPIVNSVLSSGIFAT